MKFADALLIDRDMAEQILGESSAKQSRTPDGMLDGQVQEFPDNLFPEFGHSKVSDDDWPCNCGATGCVDAMACGPGIARHGRLAVERGEQTILGELCGNDPQRWG